MKLHLDTIYTGVISGLLAPLVGMLIYYRAAFDYMPLKKFVTMILVGNALAPLMSLSLIANLGVFFLFIWKNKYHSARGVILSTLIYGACILYLKYLV